MWNFLVTEFQNYSSHEQKPIPFAAMDRTTTNLQDLKEPAVMAEWTQDISAVCQVYKHKQKFTSQALSPH